MPVRGPVPGRVRTMRGAAVADGGRAGPRRALLAGCAAMTDAAVLGADERPESRRGRRGTEDHDRGHHRVFIDRM